MPTLYGNIRTKSFSIIALVTCCGISVISGQDYIRPAFVRADQFGTDYFIPRAEKIGPSKSRFHLETLVKLENELVGLGDLILQTESKLHSKEQLIIGDNHTHDYSGESKYLNDIRDSTDAAMINLEDVVANPLAMFPIRKRLAVDWPDIMKNLTACSMVSDYASIEEHFEVIRNHLLADADLHSTYNDLLRLQKTYRIPVSSLARGWLYTARSEPLPMSDIISIANLCLEKEDMEGALEWLLQVAKLLKSARLAPEEKAIYLNILGGAYLRLNKLTESKLVYSQILKEDPKNKIAQANLKLIEEKLKSLAKEKPKEKKKTEEKPGKRGRRRTKQDDEDEEKERENIHEAWWMKYCRGDFPKVKKDESQLKCFVRHFEDGNHTFNVEILNIFPPVVYVHDFIKNFTAWKIMERAEKEISEKITRFSQEEEASTIIRMSADTPYLEPFVHTLRNVTYPYQTDTYEFDLSSVMRVYNVGAGGTSNPFRGEHYIGPHNTGYERFLIGRSFLFLNEPTYGGNIVFPYLRLEVKPSKGDALFWQFRTPNWFSESDMGLRFECPVLLGEMWFAEMTIEHHGMIDYIPFIHDRQPQVDLKVMRQFKSDKLRRKIKKLQGDDLKEQQTGDKDEKDETTKETPTKTLKDKVVEKATMPSKKMDEKQPDVKKTPESIKKVPPTTTTGSKKTTKRILKKS